MRAGRGTCLVVAVAAAAVAASCGRAAPLTATDPAATPAPKPTLRVSQLGPLTIHGSGFRGLERVRVTVQAGAAVGRTVAADRRGRFVVRFDVRLSRCGGVFVRALGSRGSRASLELPRPECREP